MKKGWQTRKLGRRGREGGLSDPDDLWTMTFAEAEED